jgi:hypothetical protein
LVGRINKLEALDGHEPVELQPELLIRRERRADLDE